MDYLFWGQIAFLLLATLAWFVFWMFAGYWKQKTLSEIVVPAVYLFPYFVVAFILFFLLALFLQYGVKS